MDCFDVTELSEIINGKVLNSVRAALVNGDNNAIVHKFPINGTLWTGKQLYELICEIDRVVSSTNTIDNLRGKFDFRIEVTPSSTFVSVYWNNPNATVNNITLKEQYFSGLIDIDYIISLIYENNNAFKLINSEKTINPMPTTQVQTQMTKSDNFIQRTYGNIKSIIISDEFIESVIITTIVIACGTYFKYKFKSFCTNYGLKMVSQQVATITPTSWKIPL